MRLIAVLAFATTLFAFDTASAAPANLPATPLDLELRQADVHNVYRLLSDVAGRPFQLDACVQGTVDLRLQNTPLPLVLDALALKLHLAYEEDGDAVRVVCPNVAALPTPRVGLSEHGAPLPDVLDRLAKSAALDGVDYRATTRPNVEMMLPPVRLTTALSALSDGFGVSLSVEGRRIVATDAKR